MRRPASSRAPSRAASPADVVEFSLEPDITRLVDAGLVDKDWNQNEHKGMVTDSVVVFMVRKGNPENIKSWDDLVTGKVEVLEPNPFTSGGAKWNIMAAYGAQLEQGKSPEQAKQYLADLFENVPVLDKSARESLQTFSSGKGDVLLGYENEAILAQQQGEDIDYIVPDETILIENPVAVVNESDDLELAKSFVDFLYTPEAQEIFVSKGYRPVVEGVPGADEFPTPSKLFDNHQVRRLGQGERRVLRPGGRRRGRDLPVTGEEHCLRLARVTAPPPAAPVSSGPRTLPIPGDVLGRGIAMAYLSIVVLIPLAAVALQVARRRRRQLLERDHQARRRWRRCGSR